MNKRYIPDRGDIVWINFDPSIGKEIGKRRPALVLSSKQHNEIKKLLICCPVTTSLRGGIEEVAVKGLDKKSAVVSNIVDTFSWSDRKIEFIKKASKEEIKVTLHKLFAYLGAEEYL